MIWQYSRQTTEARSKQSWVWLQNGDLKKKTVSLIVAAQNQSVDFEILGW